MPETRALPPVKEPSFRLIATMMMAVGGGVFVFGLVFALARSALHTSGDVHNGFACMLCTALAGIGLYAVRGQNPKTYGAFEIGVALATSWFLGPKFYAAMSIPHGWPFQLEASVPLGLLGAIYLVVNGIENIQRKPGADKLANVLLPDKLD